MNYTFRVVRRIFIGILVLFAAIVICIGVSVIT